MRIFSAVMFLLCAAAFTYILRLRGKNRVDGNCAVYLPETMFVTGAVIFCFSAVYGSMMLWFSNITAFVTMAFFTVIGLILMLKQINQRVTMTGKDSFVSGSILGKTREYRFDDYRDFEKYKDGSAELIMSEGRIKLDRMAVKDEKFFKKLREVEKKIQKI